MPRNGQGVYSLPPNTAAVTGQTIASAPYNTVNNDIANDLNAARPVTAGGTGATNAADALNNLGGVGQSNFLEAFSIGDGYYSARDISSEGGVWLRRNGALYDEATYPELAALLPDLPEGVEWTSLPSLSGSVESVIQTPSGFMAGSSSGGSTNIYTSTDGLSWGLVAVIPSFSIEAVIYQGGIYLAVDGNGKGSVSNDGVNWGTPFTIFGSGGLSSATFGNGVYVAVGTTGQISTSTDGTTWTPRTSGVSVLLFFVRYVNSIYIAGGQTGTLLTSPDGVTWTIRTSGVTESLRDVTYGSSLYVLVGGGGTILTSTNSTSWTPRTSGTTSSLNAVLYSTSGFLTVGDTGVARISTAGTSWISTPSGVSASLLSATFSPSQQNRYIVGGTSGTLLEGIRTLSTQFRVPNDAPTYGWIKADDA